MAELEFVAGCGCGAEGLSRQWVFSNDIVVEAVLKKLKEWLLVAVV